MVVSVVLATFLAGAVESIETLTVVLAAGLTRNWRSAWAGVIAGLGVLSLAVAVLGRVALAWIPLSLLNVVIGVFLLLFGSRWLVKAMLRYAGRQPLRDEQQIYQKTVGTMSRATPVASGFDRAACAATFAATLLEGAEVAFTVISFGSLGTGLLPFSVLGSLCGIASVATLGWAFRRPLVKAPENAMKYLVGLMLTALGTLWTGEGVGIHWILGPASYFGLLAVYVGFSAIVIWLVRERPADRHAWQVPAERMDQ